MFFLVLAILVILLLWVIGLCCVSGTEQQLTPANDIPLRDQVIQTDQFFFPALGPLMVSLSGGRILFVVPCVHFRLPINTICAKVKLPRYAALTPRHNEFILSNLQRQRIFYARS
jgi:hypothetical protein